MYPSNWAASIIRIQLKHHMLAKQRPELYSPLHHRNRPRSFPRSSCVGTASVVAGVFFQPSCCRCLYSTKYRETKEDVSRLLQRPFISMTSSKQSSTLTLACKTHEQKQQYRANEQHHLLVTGQARATKIKAKQRVRLGGS